MTLGPYSGVRRRAVRELKFAQARDLARILGETLATGVPATWDVQAVIPVPLHPDRQRQRASIRPNCSAAPWPAPWPSRASPP